MIGQATIKGEYYYKTITTGLVRSYPVNFSGITQGRNPDFALAAGRVVK
jgi:hypothetical protein